MSTDGSAARPAGDAPKGDDVVPAYRTHHFAVHAGNPAIELADLLSQVLDAYSSVGRDTMRRAFDLAFGSSGGEGGPS
jgi:hypothetical protein